MSLSLYCYRFEVHGMVRSFLLARFFLLFFVVSGKRHLEPGDKIPKFKEIAHTGREYTYESDFKGRGLVMWFYPKAGTAG
mmetsp:Transcript_6343/g.8925  ORF Transcript_6343/g.8925 Transcript_6343/m.8925 type:complete len:80 (+) Transcript_6343:64-303(+)